MKTIINNYRSGFASFLLSIILKIYPTPERLLLAKLLDDNKEKFLSIKY